MTVEEFNRLVMDWTRDLIDESRGNIHSESHALESSLQNLFRRSGDAIERVQVKFLKRGAYYHYGVGRGWVRQNGALVRGRRASATEAAQLRKRGYTRDEAFNHKVTHGFNLKGKREPVDWLNGPIKRNWDALAGFAQDFYGDLAMRDVLQQLSKVLMKDGNTRDI